MNLSPTARTALTVVSTAVAAVGALLASGSLADAPEWVGVAITVLGTVFAGLGIVPSQVGGTQQGIVNPTVRDLPPSENIKAAGERGAATLAVLLVVVVAALAFLVGYLVEGLVVGLIAALAAALVTALVT